MALAPHWLMMLFLARRGGVTLPPSLGAVIYFGSGNSSTVFLRRPHAGPQARAGVQAGFPTGGGLLSTR